MELPSCFCTFSDFFFCLQSTCIFIVPLGGGEGNEDGSRGPVSRGRGPPGSAWPLSQHNHAPCFCTTYESGSHLLVHIFACLWICLENGRPGAGWKAGGSLSAKGPASSCYNCQQHPLRGRWVHPLNRNDAATPLRALNLKPVRSRPYLQLPVTSQPHPRFRTQNRRQGAEDPFWEDPRGTLIRDLVGPGPPLLPAGHQVTARLTSPPSGEEGKICASPRFLYNEIKSGGTGLGRDYPDRITDQNQFPQIKTRI